MRLISLAIAFLVLVTTPQNSQAENSVGEVTGVHIVSAIDGGLATDVNKRAKLGQDVKLHAVLTVKQGRKTHYYSDASSFRLGKKKRTAKALNEAPAHVFFWHKLEPALETMSNTESGKFRFEAIKYGRRIIPSSLGLASITADVRPTLTTDRGDGVGTMRFKVSVATAEGLVASPGLESRAGRGAGGLARSVHRIAVRRDDSYLGFLTELYGQPYIWASAGRTDRSHQSETLEGSDCADFIVYGWRRMGNKVSYTWTGGLPEHTVLLKRGEVDEDGIYRDGAGKKIPFPAVGDLVLFPRHVGALTKDKGEIGVLDHEDIMMHSYFASPREQSLGDSDYASAVIETRRWK